MTVNSEHRLACDVFSNFKKNKETEQFAKRNELVKVLFISEPAVVVEGRSGVRFTVNISNLK